MHNPHTDTWTLRLKRQKKMVVAQVLLATAVQLWTSDKFGLLNHARTFVEKPVHRKAILKRTRGKEEVVIAVIASHIDEGTKTTQKQPTTQFPFYVLSRRVIQEKVSDVNVAWGLLLNQIFANDIRSLACEMLSNMAASESSSEVYYTAPLTGKTIMFWNHTEGFSTMKYL